MFKKILSTDALSYLVVAFVFAGLAMTIYGGYQVLDYTRQSDELLQTDTSTPQALQQADQARRDLDAKRADSMVVLGAGIAVIAVGWTAANALNRYRKSA